jgi:hypothetical protein
MVETAGALPVPAFQMGGDGRGPGLVAVPIEVLADR